MAKGWLAEVHKSLPDVLADLIFLWHITRKQCASDLKYCKIKLSEVYNDMNSSSGPSQTVSSYSHFCECKLLTLKWKIKTEKTPSFLLHLANRNNLWNPTVIKTKAKGFCLI